MRAAENLYLAENGWTEEGPESWSHTELDRHGLAQGHAVNVQKQYDRAALQGRPYTIRRKKPIPEPLQALIRWRDTLALDWTGEDLHFHVSGALRTTTDPTRVPEEHREALRAFQALSEDDQLTAVSTVLE